MQLFFNPGTIQPYLNSTACYGAVADPFGYDYQYNSSMQENKSPETFFR